MATRVGRWAAWAVCFAAGVVQAAGPSVATHRTTGTAPGPEIEVETEAGLPLPNGSTHAVGTIDVGENTRAIFTVRNAGTEALVDVSVSLQNVDGDYDIVQAPFATIAPGQSSVLSVQFTPRRRGRHTADIVIASNDADEAGYVIQLDGDALKGELQVQHAVRGVLPPESRHEFGTTAPGESTELALRLHNIGDGTLHLASSFFGAQAAAFQLADVLPASIPAGDFRDVALRFSPAVAGRHDARWYLETSDPAMPFIELVLIGEGGAPQLRVESPTDTEQLTGGSLPFADTTFGESATRTFVLRNVGGAAALLPGTPPVQFVGAQAGDFSLLAQPAASVPHGRIAIPGDGFENRNYDPGEWHYDPTGTEWTFSDRSGVARNGSPWFQAATPHGVQAAFLQALGPGFGGSVRQTVNFPAAGTYRVRLAAVRRGGGFSAADLDIHVGNQTVARLEADALNDDTWRWFDFRFEVAAPASLPLQLLAYCDSGDCGTAIDAVSIARDNAVTFDAVFAPSARGVRQASMHVERAGQPTFQLDVTSQGVGGNLIVEDQTGAVASGDTRAFGEVGVGASGIMLFTLRNTGERALQNLDATFEGSNAFSLDAPLPASIDPATAATLHLRFAPTTTGAQQATLHLASNDPDGAPFDLVLTGNGINGEIEVSIGGQAIADGGNAELDPADLGASSANFVVVANLGTGPLDGISASIVGADASAFAIETPPAEQLAAFGHSVMSVRFTPTRGGTHAATLQIASSDSDEAIYDIALTARGRVPEITLLQLGGSAFADGEGFDFGPIESGQDSPPLQLMLRNDGDAPLLDLAATIEGMHPDQFALLGALDPAVAPGGTFVFDIVFHPDGSGARSAVLRIASNDGDEQPFDLLLSGSTGRPEIAVFDSGTERADGATLDFGNADVGGDVARTLTVTNAGLAPLTVQSLLLQGADALQFSVDSPAPATLAPGQSLTATVHLRPSGIADPRSAALEIYSNDGDENPFDLVLAGNASAPEIALEQPAGTPIASGAQRSFGNVTLGQHADLAFTVRNEGQAPLTLSPGFGGNGANEFSIVTALPSVPPGSSAVLTVRFAPTSATARSVVLQLGSNDADEDPIVIFLAGTGRAAATADIAIDKTDGAELLEPNAQNVYTITVRNLGQLAVNGVRVVDTPPTVYTHVSWICDSFPPGLCAAAQGNGDLDQVITAPIGGGQVVSFYLFGDQAAALGTVIENTATVTVIDPAAQDSNLANNSATDVTRVAQIRVFHSGFE